MPGVVFFVYDDGVGGGRGRGVGGGGLQQRGRVLGGEAGAREEVAEGDVCAGGLEGRNGAGGCWCVGWAGLQPLPLAPWRREFGGSISFLLAG